MRFKQLITAGREGTGMEWVAREVGRRRRVCELYGEPSWGELVDLAARETETISIHRADVRGGCCLHQDGRAIILVAAEIDDDTAALLLAHELGHVILRGPCGAYLRQHADTPELRRLSRRWTLQDEAAAWEWCRLWWSQTADWVTVQRMLWG